MALSPTRRRFLSLVGTAATAAGLSGTAGTGDTEGTTTDEDFGGTPLPTSPGGAEAGEETATFDDGLTLDYVLPSPDLKVRNRTSSGRPRRKRRTDELLADVEAASDHRLVWTDLTIDA